jgi:hypothetical protein
MTYNAQQSRFNLLLSIYGRQHQHHTTYAHYVLVSDHAFRCQLSQEFIIYRYDIETMRHTKNTLSNEKMQEHVERTNLSCNTPDKLAENEAIRERSTPPCSHKQV